MLPASCQSDMSSWQHEPSERSGAVECGRNSWFLCRGTYSWNLVHCYRLCPVSSNVALMQLDTCLTSFLILLLAMDTHCFMSQAILHLCAHFKCRHFLSGWHITTEILKMKLNQPTWLILCRNMCMCGDIYLPCVVYLP